MVEAPGEQGEELLDGAAQVRGVARVAGDSTQRSDRSEILCRTQGVRDRVELILGPDEGVTVLALDEGAYREIGVLAIDGITIDLD